MVIILCHTVSKIIICHLWIFIEIYQYFREQLNQILFQTLHQSSQYFKDNRQRSREIAHIITDFMAQNLDKEYNECFRNNADFNKRISEIYAKMESFHYVRGWSTAWKLVCVNPWIDKYVLHILNIPKDWMIVTLQDTGIRDTYEDDADVRVRPRFINGDIII